MVKIHIWHDVNNGKIVGIGRSSASAKYKAIPTAGHRQGVLETQVEEDAIGTLHETHKVDVLNKTLVRVVSTKK
jgi:hypothetical protein